MHFVLCPRLSPRTRGQARGSRRTEIYGGGKQKFNFFLILRVSVVSPNLAESSVIENVVWMKKSILFGVLIFGMFIACNIGAFDKGQNRIQNSGFEADKIGAPPVDWKLAISG